MSLVVRIAALSKPALLIACASIAGCASRDKESTEPRPTISSSARALPRAISALGKTSQPARSAAGRPPSSPNGLPPAKDAAAEALAAPAVYARTRFVWIYPEPDAALSWIGYLWIGGSAKLRSEKPRFGPGCMTWYAIEPYGFVCVDGVKATLDPKDPVVQAGRAYGPKLDSAWPHRYAESRGAQRYRKIPTPDEQRQREWDVQEHMKRLEAARSGQIPESLRGVDLLPSPSEPITLGNLPPVIYENRKELRPLSTVAYSAEMAAHGRSWLLSHDFMWVAKDRVAPYPVVNFRGVELGKTAQLPLAFFRGKARPKYKKDGSGAFVETGKSWERLSWVELTGQHEDSAGETYLETREPATYVKKTDAVVPVPQPQTPWGAPVFGEDKSGFAPKGRRTWLEASIWKGWLIAYEGTKPVYVTLISPGRGGTPVPDKDPLSTASTPTGRFPISGKFATATMEAPNEFIHSDVPWTQNFSGPHAIHGTYWHDNWGNRMSAGCVNVSPADGRWLFNFTEPVLPPGWHGVRWRPYAEPATTFIVHD